MISQPFIMESTQLCDCHIEWCLSDVSSSLTTVLLHNRLLYTAVSCQDSSKSAITSWWLNTGRCHCFLNLSNGNCFLDNSRYKLTYSSARQPCLVWPVIAWCHPTQLAVLHCKGCSTEPSPPLILRQHELFWRVMRSNYAALQVTTVEIPLWAKLH